MYYVRYACTKMESRTNCHLQMAYIYSQSSTLHSDEWMLRNKYLNSDNRKMHLALGSRGTNYPIFIYKNNNKKKRDHTLLKWPWVFAAHLYDYSGQLPHDFHGELTIWNCIDHFFSAKSRLTSKPIIDTQLQTQIAYLLCSYLSPAPAISIQCH